MDDPRASVVCAGGAVLDRKFVLHAAAVIGTSNPALGSTSSGGVARNVAENLAGLLAGSPVRVALVSAVGADDAGVGLLAGLRAGGVDVAHVRVVPGASTAQYVAVLQPGGDLVLGVAAMGVLDQVDTAALDAAWPAGGWLFCDTNLAPAVLEHALRRARADSGVRLALDAVSVPKVIRLPADLRGIALLGCNLQEARAWVAGPGSGRAADRAPVERLGPVERLDPVERLGPVELAGRLRAAGAGAVLLTRGAAGVVLADAGGVRELPAVRAEVVDVTGAGDALLAGTLAALVEPAAGAPDLLAAVRAGIALAARTVASERSVLAAG